MTADARTSPNEGWISGKQSAPARGVAGAAGVSFVTSASGEDVDDALYKASHLITADGLGRFGDLHE
jgi:hypothetical protein